MSNFTRQVKAWLPPLAGLCGVFISAGYAWSLKRSAAQEIGQLHELSADLDTAAEDVRTASMSPEEIRKLEQKEGDLRQRMGDVRKPGLVQAELMASARAANLEVRDIQPIPSSRGAGAAESSCPNYRVSVTGSYQQIAEYMHLCKSHRLPVRVVGLRMSRLVKENGRSADSLTAELTVEAFHPPGIAPRGS